MVERHSTIVVLCLSAISTEEVEKCMRWSFEADLTAYSFINIEYNKIKN